MPLVRDSNGRLEINGTGALITIAGQYDSVLDIGCGKGNLLHGVNRIASRREHTNPRRFLGLDMCVKALAEARANVKAAAIEYRQVDVRAIGSLFEEQEFECVTGMDIIEHLELEDANKVLDLCDKIAEKCQLYFIPVGDHPQTDDPWGYDNEHWNTHRSVWQPQMMVDRGFEVWHYPDWHVFPAGVKKSTEAMWCLKDSESKPEIHLR